MYTRIDVYSLLHGSAKEAIQSVNEGLLPIIERQAGFISYRLVESSDCMVSVSTWRSKEHSTEGVVQAADFVRDHLSEHVTLEHSHAGTVVLSREK